MGDSRRVKLLIIGSGAAGYTAAIYAARANLKPLLVQGMQPGGQMTITTDVENYPGFAETIQGPWLMEQMGKQAEHVGTEMLFDLVTGVDFSTRPLTVRCDSGLTILADAVIIATGAQARWLGLESEQAFQGYGVSACATCDGFFFKDKPVIVVGGGNAAVEEALYLSHIASQVTVVHRRDAFRGEKILHDRLFANPRIKVIWDSVLEEVTGETDPVPRVTGARIRNLKTGQQSDLAVDGLFVAIGHVPATAPFKGQVKLDAEGYVVVRPGTCDTGIPGVYAAGDVADKTYRQAVTAAAMGCMAALDAERWLARQQTTPLAQSAD